MGEKSREIVAFDSPDGAFLLADAQAHSHVYDAAHIRRRLTAAMKKLENGGLP